jgi:hypothetical protein
MAWGIDPLVLRFTYLDTSPSNHLNIIKEFNRGKYRLDDTRLSGRSPCTFVGVGRVGLEFDSKRSSLLGNIAVESPTTSELAFVPSWVDKMLARLTRCAAGPPIRSLMFSTPRYVPITDSSGTPITRRTFTNMPVTVSLTDGTTFVAGQGITLRNRTRTTRGSLAFRFQSISLDRKSGVASLRAVLFNQNNQYFGPPPTRIPLKTARRRWERDRRTAEGGLDPRVLIIEAAGIQLE